MAKRKSCELKLKLADEAVVPTGEALQGSLEDAQLFSTETQELGVPALPLATPPSDLVRDPRNYLRGGLFSKESISGAGLYFWCKV